MRPRVCSATAWSMCGTSRGDTGNASWTEACFAANAGSSIGCGQQHASSWSGSTVPGGRRRSAGHNGYRPPRIPGCISVPAASKDRQSTAATLGALARERRASFGRIARRRTLGGTLAEVRTWCGTHSAIPWRRGKCRPADGEEIRFVVNRMNDGRPLAGKIRSAWEGIHRFVGSCRMAWHDPRAARAKLRPTTILTSRRRQRRPSEGAAARGPDTLRAMGQCPLDSHSRTAWATLPYQNQP
jgi:hypothetical protein